VGITRYPKTRIFGSKQLKYDNPGKLDGAGDHYHCTGIAWRGGEGDSAETILEDAIVMSPCAAAAIYHRDIYVSMGGMAEDFFCYYEDVDLGLRFRLLGHETIQLAGAKVRHVGSTTAGKNSKFIKYYVSRNRIWTFIRCVPGSLFAACLPLMILSIVTRLCFSIFAGDTSTKLKAFFDAFRRLFRIWNDRKVIQKARKSTVLQFGSDMTWSVGKLILRSSDCRPISPEKFSKEPGTPFQAGGLDGS
jgi:GT2 family glycosyltransferase